MMKNLLAAFLAAFFVSGCDLLSAFDDGYQPGDLLRSVIKTKAQYERAIEVYCASTSTDMRTRLINRIRTYNPDYVGKCTG